MKSVQQTILFPPKGNCFAACVASILELPLDEVPNFCGDHPDDWWNVLQSWLVCRNLFALEILISEDNAPQMYPVPDVPFIAVGKSPRGEWDHCIVCHYPSGGGPSAPLHDPHPDGTFIEGRTKSLLFFAALKPERIR